MIAHMAAKAVEISAKTFSRWASGTDSIRLFFMKKYSRIKVPVIVHNMAKVGSKTIVQSLKSFDPWIEVYQTHYLSQKGLIRAEEYMRKLPNRFWDHIDENQRISRRIQCDSRTQKWHVISLVRDPVERDVSFFFTVLNIYIFQQ